MRKEKHYSDDHKYLDREATAFARCLLMPETQVRKTWDMCLATHSLRPVEEMSIMFAVEKTEMARRLAELDLI